MPIVPKSLQQIEFLRSLMNKLVIYLLAIYVEKSNRHPGLWPVAISLKVIEWQELVPCKVLNLKPWKASGAQDSICRGGVS
jgi:hypothetical protein